MLHDVRVVADGLAPRSLLLIEKTEEEKNVWIVVVGGAVSGAGESRPDYPRCMRCKARDWRS